jgi:uncharacterized membrane protein HdeD (DUF308 family)
LGDYQNSIPERKKDCRIPERDILQGIGKMAAVCTMLCVACPTPNFVVLSVLIGTAWLMLRANVKY